MLLVFRGLIKVYFQIDKASQTISHPVHELQMQESEDEDEDEVEDEYYHEEDDGSEMSTDDES